MSVAKLVDGRYASRNQDGVKGYFDTQAEALAWDRSSGSSAPTTRTSAGTVSSPAAQSQYTPSSSYTGGAYTMSDFGLASINGVTWLVDGSNNTIRPFESETALMNFYGGNVPVESIIPLDASALVEGGPLAGYQVLSSDYRVKGDGSSTGLDFSNSQLTSKYGAATNQEAEEASWRSVYGFLDLLKNEGISEATINNIKNNDSQMAYYMSALAYGGYSFGDIYSDVKARDMGLTDVFPISSTVGKDQYASSSEYRAASTDNRIMPPDTIGALNASDLNLSIFALPDDAFNTLVPLLDPTSKEFQDAMDDIETSYYDVMQQQLNAQTDQDKAVADYNYEEWKKSTEQSLGITLSNNAIEAWNQVQSAYGDASQRGIYGSGLQNEGIDDYLRSVRKSDQNQRDQVQSEKDSQEMQYYLTAATAEQINDLIESDREKAERWGLVPSSDIKDALSMSSLREKYPNASEDDLAQYISIILDENGNYRSTLYQKQVGSLSDLNPANASYTTTGIGTAKEQFQRDKVYSNAGLDEEAAYKEYTTPEVDFLRTSGTGAPEGYNAPGSIDLSGAIKKATDQGVYKAPTVPTSYDVNDNSKAAIDSRRFGTSVTPSTKSYTAPKVENSYTAPKTSTKIDTSKSYLSSGETVAETYARAQKTLAGLNK